MFLDTFLHFEFKIFFTIISAVILFLFGIDNFSKEVQRLGGVRFHKFISKWTKNRWLGALSGAFVTSVIQSSSATSVIVVALVNIGVLSLTQSLPIIIGSNVGSTLTAQLVALKLSGIGPFFIVIGFILSLIKIRYSILGKSIFYFGFVFFSLDMISTAIEPIKSNQELIHWLSQDSYDLFGIALGALFTALVQSSSVTTGIAVILVQQNVITLQQGLYIIMGANIGTTFTALFSSWNMDRHAKKAALGHLFFNFIGVLLVLPWVSHWKDFLYSFQSRFRSQDLGQILANAHLMFNLGAMVLFLIFLKPFTFLINWLIKTQDKEIVFHPKFISSSQNGRFEDNFQLIKKELRSLVHDVYEAIDLVTNCFVSMNRHQLLRINKITSYINFMVEEIRQFSDKLARQASTDIHTEQLSTIIQVSVIFKEVSSLLSLLVSSVENFSQANGHKMKPETLSAIIQILNATRNSFLELEILYEDYSETQYFKLKNSESDLYLEILKQNKVALDRLRLGKVPSGGTLIEILSLCQNLREKINSNRKYLKLLNKEIN